MGKTGIKIITIPTAPIEENCYLCYDAEKKEALVIDPGNEAERILDAIREQELKVQAILLTHGHWDHIGAVEAVRKALGVKVFIHADDAAMLTDKRQNLFAFMETHHQFAGSAADVLLHEGDKISCGSIEFQVIHTPGHTPGGACYYAPAAGVLFSGDSLFAEEIGRCDFPGGSLSALISSLKRKVITLPEDTKVYPGHGPATDVGWERAHNPYVGIGS